MQILLFIVSVLLFMGLVIIHEWGHYFAARRNGVQVEEFGLGFPPRAASRKTKSGMILSLNWLPLGGFVRLKGEHDADKRKGSFGAAPLTAKVKIMLAGVTMNLLAGLLLLTILALVGMPKIIDKQFDGHDQFTVASDTKVIRQEVLVGYVEPSSPAAKAGLSGRDILESVNTGNRVINIKSSAQLKTTTESLAGQSVKLTLHRNGQLITKQVTLRTKASVAPSLKTDNPKGYLGISPNQLQIRRSTWSAPIVAVGFTKQLIGLTLKGLGHALSGLGSLIAGGVTGNHTARVNGQSEASSQVGGPVAIMAVLWGAGSLGILFILMIIAVISLTLALMNILPLPALDGGRLAVTLISRGLFRRPLSRRVEERIHGTGMAVLLALILLITIVDVQRFF